MSSTGIVDQHVIDERAASAADSADPEVVSMWRALGSLAAAPALHMGLLAGERPAADVEVLASMAAIAEYELARRLVLADAAGSLPLRGGAVLRARGWSAGAARRLMAAGRVALTFEGVAEQWRAGVITAEHAAAIERNRGRLTDHELAVALRGFDGRWGAMGPRAVGEVIAAVESRMHPAPDPTAAEVDAHRERHLSFALTEQEVLFTGSLPRLEGEAFLAVIDAFAETLRSAADEVPAAARRADGLIALVQAAAASGSVPARGGLPVALTVTLTQTEHGDVVATTSRGHTLTPAEQRFVCCDPTLTPVLVGRTAAPRSATGLPVPTATARVLAIAESLLGNQVPLAVGRTSRIATPAQRRALAVRDKGCAIPGCGIPAEICQVHHLQEWAEGGATDLDNEVLLCWTHHRAVDLNQWTIERSASGWTVTPQPRTLWRL